MFLKTLVAVLLVVALANASCPSVVARYSPLGRLQISWSDLPIEDVVSTEWAIVPLSDIGTLLAQGLSLGSCTTQVNYVAAWNRIGNKVTSASSATYLPAAEAEFVLLRVYYRGGLVQHSLSQAIEQASDMEVLSARAARSTSYVDPLVPENRVCPIDMANRCRQASENVGARLLREYGEPEWPINGQIGSLVRGPVIVSSSESFGAESLSSSSS